MIQKVQEQVTCPQQWMEDAKWCGTRQKS
jgi:hypothetical protein